MRTRLLTLALAATVAAPAVAATPESGSVSAEKVKQTWNGEAYGQPLNNTPATMNERFCLSPFCDTFPLTVTGPGTLDVRISSPGSAGFVEVEVTYPDGTVEDFDGASGETVQDLVFEDVETGTYTFRVWTNQLYGLNDGMYSGRAILTPPLAQ